MLDGQVTTSAVSNMLLFNQNSIRRREQVILFYASDWGNRQGYDTCCIASLEHPLQTHLSMTEWAVLGSEKHGHQRVSWTNMLTHDFSKKKKGRDDATYVANMYLWGKKICHSYVYNSSFVFSLRDAHVWMGKLWNSSNMKFIWWQSRSASGVGYTFEGAWYLLLLFF